MRVLLDGQDVESATPRVAEPGPLVAMKLQSVMDRGRTKQATDLDDIVRLVLDPTCGPVVLTQIAGVDAAIATDIAIHVEHWFAARRRETTLLLRDVLGSDLTEDDIELVADLLAEAAHR